MASSGERSVQVVGADGTRARRLAWEQLPDLNFQLTLEMPVGFANVVGRDLFHCLEQLRLLLEPEGLSVAVQGSRTNAWASGMQRNMTGAQKIYIHRNGHHLEKSDIVNIFDDADQAGLATVAAQRESYRLWRESVRDVRAT